MKNLGVAVASGVGGGTTATLGPPSPSSPASATGGGFASGGGVGSVSSFTPLTLETAKAIPDLGDSLHNVCDCIWRAVFAVVRADLTESSVSVHPPARVSPLVSTDLLLFAAPPSPLFFNVFFLPLLLLLLLLPLLAHKRTHHRTLTQ